MWDQQHENQFKLWSGNIQYLYNPSSDTDRLA